MVFYHDVNKNEIRPLNIFSHHAFMKDVQTELKKSKTKNEFSEKLSKDLLYYFWAKAEYEVIISPWCGRGQTKDIKVDIYTQVKLNWDVFVDYVWNKREPR